MQLKINNFKNAPLNPPDTLHNVTNTCFTLSIHFICTIAPATGALKNQMTLITLASSYMFEVFFISLFGCFCGTFCKMLVVAFPTQTAGSLLFSPLQVVE